MLDFLLLCLPIFGVIGLGWAAARLQWMRREAIDSLAGFAFWYALPALLIRLLAQQPLGEIFDARFFFWYLLACCIVFGLSLAGAMVLGRRGLADAAAHAGAVAIGNVGFLGPPLLIAIFGPRSAGPLAMVIMVEVMAVMAVGSALMALGKGRGSGLARQLARAVLLHPVILAIAFGSAFGASGWGIPPWLDRFLLFLGGAAGPAALFALGGALGRLRVGRDLVLAAGALTFGKLVAYPALVWLILSWVGLDPFWVSAGALLAAMPTATNAFVLAQRFGADEETVSATVLLTSLVAAVSFPLTAWLLHAGQ